MIAFAGFLLFCAFAVAAMYAMRRGRWLDMALFMGIAFVGGYVMITNLGAL
jgi:hypothetical protein